MKRKSIYKVIIIGLLPIALLAPVENWIYRYDGPASGSDRAESIAYGADGNIYAAGSSEGSGSESDFFVASLAPSDPGVTEFEDMPAFFSFSLGSNPARGKAVFKFSAPPCCMNKALHL
jgi:hypothetical protein